jgi:hypothetical protein
MGILFHPPCSLPCDNCGRMGTDQIWMGPGDEEVLGFCLECCGIKEGHGRWWVENYHQQEKEDERLREEARSCWWTLQKALSEEHYSTFNLLLHSISTGGEEAPLQDFVIDHMQHLQGEVEVIVKGERLSCIVLHEDDRISRLNEVLVAIS